jgi:hypothetical protein
MEMLNLVVFAYVGPEVSYLLPSALAAAAGFVMMVGRAPIRWAKAGFKWVVGGFRYVVGKLKL